MSHDLFAAFGGESSGDKDQHGGTYFTSIQPEGGFQQTQYTQGTPKTSVNASHPEEVDTSPAGLTGGEDDDFGDFEDASASVVQAIAHQSTKSPVAEDVSAPQPTQVESRIATRPTRVPSINGVNAPMPPIERKVMPLFGPRKRSPIRLVPKEETKSSHPFAGRMNILFDAGDDEYDAGADELADLATNPEAAMAYSKRIIAEQEAAKVKKEMSKPAASKIFSVKAPTKVSSGNGKDGRSADSGPKKLRKKSGYVPARDADVLFDAETEDMSRSEQDLDDFGDFENVGENATSTVESSVPSQLQNRNSVPAIDLLGLGNSSESQDNVDESGRDAPPNLRNLDWSKPNPTQQVSQPSLMGTALRQDDNVWDDFQASEPISQPMSTFSPQPNDAYELDNNVWDDFEAAEPPNRSSTSNSSLPLPSSYSQTVSNTSASTSSASSLPPANIPPPAIVLSIFPSLFAAADEALFDTLSKLDLKQRLVLLAHPASHQFLKGYLGHGTVLAHVIAGRKLRWKRDQHLSQSMRIGPAAAGGKGGMKLTGLDKSETAKEDREVLDALRLWKAQVGKLRTAVTAASSAPAVPKLPPVPDIAEQMPVKTLRPAEGGITAPHACALCGLKREERVAKVDVEVEDSFGEWWIQGTDMHVSCKRFWEEFEKKLKSR